MSPRSLPRTTFLHVPRNRLPNFAIPNAIIDTGCAHHSPALMSTAQQAKKLKRESCFESSSFLGRRRRLKLARVSFRRYGQDYVAGSGSARCRRVISCEIIGGCERPRSVECEM